MKFRPCIDLHGGAVKQIVGGTLDASERPTENFVSDLSAAHYAAMYAKDRLLGGHVIMLGAGNDGPATEALRAYPKGLQVGGDVNASNAKAWLDKGASHVIVTSWVFTGGELSADRLAELVAAVGRDRLVLDLSCRKRGADYYVVTDRWQNFTSLKVDAET